MSAIDYTKLKPGAIDDEGLIFVGINIGPDYKGNSGIAYRRGILRTEFTPASKMSHFEIVKMSEQGATRAHPLASCRLPTVDESLMISRLGLTENESELLWKQRGEMFVWTNKYRDTGHAVATHLRLPDWSGANWFVRTAQLHTCLIRTIDLTPC